MTVARVLLAVDDGQPIEVASTEVHDETVYTAVPSLLRALVDEYESMLRGT